VVSTWAMTKGLDTDKVNQVRQVYSETNWHWLEMLFGSIVLFHYLICAPGLPYFALN
jgi:hypothetical protein